jgi:hypothetical protein
MSSIVIKHLTAPIMQLNLVPKENEILSFRIRILENV